jgi:N6-adenosine-specific RNA methylase IME4
MSFELGDSGIEFSLVWDKEIPGMGHYWRIQHEHVLLAIPGRPGIARVHNLPSVIRERHRGKHSVKPAVLYEHIEAMYPEATKIELFARSRRLGWDAWRNELSNERGDEHGQDSDLSRLPR